MLLLGGIADGNYHVAFVMGSIKRQWGYLRYVSLIELIAIQHLNQPYSSWLQ